MPQSEHEICRAEDVCLTVEKYFLYSPFGKKREEDMPENHK